MNNKEIRDLQASVEAIKADLKSRRPTFAKLDVQNLKSIIKRNEQNYLAIMPPNHVQQAKESIDRLKEDIAPLEKAISFGSDTGTGSQQEREFLDDAFAAQSVLSKELSNLEQLAVPDDFRRQIPAEYSNLPVLQGRAEVSIVIKKPDDSKFDIDGKLYDEAVLKLVVDGYNAPITGGNFIDLVNNGFYNNKVVSYPT